MAQQSTGAARPITGRTVLVCFILFFGMIAAMNTVLIRAATSTFGGVETENAYKAGLNFGRDISASREQDRRHWRVDGKVSLDAQSNALADLTVNDANDRPIGGLSLKARLAHPTNRKLDRRFETAQVAPGRYRGVTEAAAGQWDFIVELERDGVRTFQSRTRVNLK